jgi:DNA-binding response OmpR family regulator
MTGKTILCVDDEAHILQVVSLKLQNAGFNVVTASDADEAFDLAQGQQIDLVITDYQMPGPTGLDLARKLHKEPGKRDLPLILLTAHGLALDQVELARAGVACSLSKPFSPREVLGKVHGLLEQAEKAAATREAPAAAVESAPGV